MTAADLGVVVNPVAGMGGRVGLHGTEPQELERARALGAVPVAPDRARRALDRLHELAPGLSAVVAEGAMGGDYLPNAGQQVKWRVSTLPVTSGTTQAKDTRDVVRQMVGRGVRLVLFVGGDGTARDVAAASADVPVLGVPAGVKMHSGVFGLTPEASAEAAARFLSRPSTSATAIAEVVDRDDDGVVRLHGTVTVPAVPAAVQRRKASAGPTDADLAGLGREIADQMQPGRLYLLGPGTTVATVNAALELPATLLGVDAVLDGALLGAGRR